MEKARFSSRLRNKSSGQCSIESCPKVKVCSLHFTKKDYTLADVTAKKRQMKQIAISSCKLPGSSKVKIFKNFEMNDATLQDTKFSPSKQSDELLLIIKEEPDIVIKEEELDIPIEEEDRNDHMDDSPNDTEIIKSEPISDNSELEAIYDIIVSDSISATIKSEFSSTVPLFFDVGVQVGTSNPLPRFANFLQNDRDLNIATGINSFKILDCIVKLLRQVFGDQLEHANFKLSLHDRVIMTYFKLKHNIPYDVLSIFFPHYTIDDCKRIFLDMLNALAVVLGILITWPSKQVILKKQPEIHDTLENIKLAIDSMIIFIEEPKKNCRKILTLSGHKKILTGVAPNGTIIYKSQIWGGEASEASIFEHSDLINLLEPNDTIMADEKFAIHDICTEKKLNLITPPLSNHKRGSSENSPTIIARKAIKVNVERSIRKIKTFKFLNEPISPEFIPDLGNIFTIICATINLSSPHSQIEEKID